jgi:8-hydroxy-5-deazaflavin:NADPH oxidoreductase
MSRPIAIVGGTGKEGFGLATRWAHAGETVFIGSRDPQRAEEAAAKIKQRVGTWAQVSGGENKAVCAEADIIVLTIPFENHAEMLRQLKPTIQPGNIVVDTTVPLAASVGGKPTRMLGIWQGSAAQQTAEILADDDVSVVAAFQNVSSELLNGVGPVDCDVIVCSDDADAIELVRALAEKIPGVRGISGGKLENARIVEQITAMLIGMNRRHAAHSGIRITGLPEAAYKTQLKS